MSATLLVLANVFVCVSELWVSSCAASVFVGTIPVWIVLFNWVWFEKSKPIHRLICYFWEG